MCAQASCQEVPVNRGNSVFWSEHRRSCAELLSTRELPCCTTLNRNRTHHANCSTRKPVETLSAKRHRTEVQLLDTCGQDSMAVQCGIIWWIGIRRGRLILSCSLLRLQTLQCKEHRSVRSDLNSVSTIGPKVSARESSNSIPSCLTWWQVRRLSRSHNLPIHRKTMQRLSTEKFRNQTGALFTAVLCSFSVISRQSVLHSIASDWSHKIKMKVRNFELH